VSLPRSGELAPSKRPLVTRGVALIYLGRVLIQSQLVTANLINVRFGPLCGLKPGILRGPRSAISRHSVVRPAPTDASQLRCISSTTCALIVTWVQ